MYSQPEYDSISLAKVARGEEVADLLLKNAKVIDCFRFEIKKADVAIKGERIAGIGEGFKAKEEIDLKGLYLSPSFIDAHIHIESTMLTPLQFAMATVPHGTGVVVSDPHEIANCLGVDGIKYMLLESRDLPLSFFFTAPSCVPATHLETSGAILGPQDIQEVLKMERIVALGEMMNFPGVIFGDKVVHEKLRIARSLNLPIDGHAPGLSGKDLCSYISSSIDSDHECTDAREALEKLGLGMWIFLREGTSEKNLVELLSAVNQDTAKRCCLCTDDRHPDEILDNGHMDYNLKLAVSRGIDPLVALSMATINPAQRFNLKGLGAISPGYLANLVALDDLSNFSIRMTFHKGILVARDGKALFKAKEIEPDERISKSINIDLSGIDLKIPAKSKRIRVIGIREGQILTDEKIVEAKVQDGLAVSNPNRDIVKLVVIERHHRTGNIGYGFVQGLGLKKGAIASTVSHDSHNLIVAGVDDESMLNAISALIEAGGGLCVATRKETKALLPLKICGLMSEKPAEVVSEELERLLKAIRSLGCKMKNPFMNLSFLALPVIPRLKLTDRGLVDVDSFSFVPLFVE